MSLANFVFQGERKGKITVQNYLVFYLIDHAEKALIIMRILHGAREYRDLL
ncbi:type II toxin-antitoxin system RelE/ParE family toxin [Schaedlerella sp.]|uniref:type II toxin-antitoxin system RelE/ParE family toxin n=1 Tax=Schaedlerella sp. TaxID=2676057 RepID=UPI003747B830